jgi:hypothetical protein
VFLHPANARLEFADLTHRASRMSQTRGGLPADYLSLAPDRAVSLATPAAVRHYHKKCLKYWILPTQWECVDATGAATVSTRAEDAPAERRAGGGSVNQAARETGGGGGTP